MDGLLKAKYEHGKGNTLTVSGGLRAGKLMKLTADLCIGNPITIGGALVIDLGWLNFSIQVEMLVNGGWVNDNKIGFRFKMGQFCNIDNSVAQFGIYNKDGNGIGISTQMEVLTQREGKVLNKDCKVKGLYCCKENRGKLEWGRTTLRAPASHPCLDSVKGASHPCLDSVKGSFFVPHCGQEQVPVAGSN
ncbi:hypothetical protein L195_g008635 [Trifolium pratense]|uniref:Uncharacterized protein n=1 Tax=Trifolium pratense TaxID=57577 RepID=A0A2K3P9S4_TRIPR|nr:hypothetical protein L195_g008635 [Trifolium pratense]